MDLKCGVDEMWDDEDGNATWAFLKAAGIAQASDGALDAARTRTGARHR
jgi:hypothetical protein